jgi:hypothetical protein
VQFFDQVGPAAYINVVWLEVLLIGQQPKHFAAAENGEKAAHYFCKERSEKFLKEAGGCFCP